MIIIMIHDKAYRLLKAGILESCDINNTPRTYSVLKEGFKPATTVGDQMSGGDLEYIQNAIFMLGSLFPEEMKDNRLPHSEPEKVERGEVPVQLRPH